MKTELLLFDQSDMSLQYEIHSDGELISLTDLWNAAGSDPNKSPYKWSRTDQTQGFLKAAQAFLKRDLKSLYKTQRGKNSGGTWAHKHIALEYAQYLDPKLAVIVNQTFFERMAEEKDPELVLNRWKQHYEKLGKSKEWIDERFKGVGSRKSFTSTLSAHGVNGRGYSDCTNAIYKPLYGGGAGLIRVKKGLPEKKGSIRDNMSSLELSAVGLAEHLAEEKIRRDNLQGNTQCEEASRRSSQSVAAAVTNALK